MPTQTATRPESDTGPDNRFEHLLRLLRRISGDEKHAPSAHSTLDVLWVLYDRVLRLTPGDIDSPDRDRFLLSKGHGPAAYYAVLAAKGHLGEDLLDHMGAWTSPLGHHPDRLTVPAVEISSGSLGHGLPIGVGMALGLRAQGLTEPRIYVLLGDAELDEGANHEAIAYAGAVSLASLTAIVIDNSSATYGWPGGISSRFTVNGWTAASVDGRDHAEIEKGLRSFDGTRPHVIVARTPRK
ncbi:MAG TPA: transketolase [Micromonosporaceae bacterium]